MKILFICKYNVFRSRIAEEYFKKINKNPHIKAISRGLIMGGKPDKEAIEIAGDLLTKRKPISVKIQELIEADLIVVVANDIPKIIFDYQKVDLIEKLMIWGIKDEQMRNKSNINNIILNIKERVEKLNSELEKST